MMSEPDQRDGSWTLLTGHGHVLVEIARNPRARIRDLAAAAGITERTTQAIVADLEAAGYLTRTRTGRRTTYTVNPDSRFRHPAQGGHRVGPFLSLLAADGNAFTAPSPPGPDPAPAPPSPSRPAGTTNPRRRQPQRPHGPRDGAATPDRDRTRGPW
jgi:MarR family